MSEFTPEEKALLTPEKIKAWKMNNASMSPNEFVELCEMALRCEQERRFKHIANERADLAEARINNADLDAIAEGLHELNRIRIAYLHNLQNSVYAPSDLIESGAYRALRNLGWRRDSEK